MFEKYNLNPQDCLFVTDTLGDLIEAKEVEVNSIGVLGGYHQRERLERGEPKKIIKSLDELISLVDKI